VIQVGPRLIQQEWTQPSDGRYPLPQLLLFRPSKFSSQLRLSGQDDLQQFRPRCFKVRKLAQGFQYRAVEILRLIDHHDHPLSSKSCLGQQMVQLAIQLGVACFPRIYLQFDEQGLEKFVGVVLLLKQERRPGTVKSFQDVKRQSGFAHARLGYQNLKSESAFDAIDQRS
jgi:hypothetical protein